MIEPVNDSKTIEYVYSLVSEASADGELIDPEWARRKGFSVVVVCEDFLSLTDMDDYARKIRSLGAKHLYLYTSVKCHEQTGTLPLQGRIELIPMLMRMQVSADDLRSIYSSGAGHRYLMFDLELCFIQTLVLEEYYVLAGSRQNVEILLGKSIEEQWLETQSKTESGSSTPPYLKSFYRSVMRRYLG